MTDAQPDYVPFKTRNENQSQFHSSATRTKQVYAQTVVTTHRSAKNVLRETIPKLPIALAYILCFINIVLPGIGTILAAFSFLCCGRVEQKEKRLLFVFFVNFGVGIAQIATLVIFFLGWVWSIMWGVAFIAIAGEPKDFQTKPVTSDQGEAPANASQALPQC